MTNRGCRRAVQDIGCEICAHDYGTLWRVRCSFCAVTAEHISCLRATREAGEAWECDGLFVADASTFPTSLGINPIITVEAVAYMIAEKVSTYLPHFFRDVVFPGRAVLRRHLSAAVLRHLYLLR